MNWKRDWATFVLAMYGVMMMTRDLARLAGWIEP